MNQNGDIQIVSSIVAILISAIALALTWWRGHSAERSADEAIKLSREALKVANTANQIALDTHRQASITNAVRLVATKVNEASRAVHRCNEILNVSWYWVSNHIEPSAKEVSEYRVEYRETIRRAFDEIRTLFFDILICPIEVRSCWEAHVNKSMKAASNVQDIDIIGNRNREAYENLAMLGISFVTLIAVCANWHKEQFDPDSDPASLRSVESSDMKLFGGTGIARR